MLRNNSQQKPVKPAVLTDRKIQDNLSNYLNSELTAYTQYRWTVVRVIGPTVVTVAWIIHLN